MAGTKPLASIGFISGLPAARSGVPVLCFGDRQPVAKTPLGPLVESGGALAGPVALETVLARGLRARVAGSACCWFCSQKKTFLTCSSFKLTSFFTLRIFGSWFRRSRSGRACGLLSKVTSGSKPALISLRMIRWLLRPLLLMTDL